MPSKNKFRRKSSELLNQIVATGSALLVERLGVTEAVATEVARDYAHEIARIFGGQLFYFPKDIALKLTRRDRKLFQEFTGANHEELARRYDMSVIHIYRIIDRVRREELARVQGKLFPIEDAA